MWGFPASPPGRLAQLVERSLDTREVRGSSPLLSTASLPPGTKDVAICLVSAAWWGWGTPRACTFRRGRRRIGSASGLTALPSTNNNWRRSSSHRHPRLIHRSFRAGACRGRPRCSRCLNTSDKPGRRGRCSPNAWEQKTTSGRRCLVPPAVMKNEVGSFIPRGSTFIR